MSDLIDRQKAMDALDRIFDQCEEIEAHLPKGDPDRTGYKMYPDYMTVWKYLHQLPSAEPELDEWCTDCKEYDQERHCCPRWNRVIRNTLKDAELERKKEKWIPCSERLPEKHQMVLTTIKGVDLFRECADKNFFEALATAKKRTFVSVGYLGDDGWYGADGFPQIIPTVAWMPMPEPYKEGE